jgi:hypothetical protein
MKYKRLCRNIVFVIVITTLVVCLLRHTTLQTTSNEWLIHISKSDSIPLSDILTNDLPLTACLITAIGTIYEIIIRLKNDSL